MRFAIHRTTVAALLRRHDLPPPGGR
jgi:hypothetical protein